MTHAECASVVTSPRGDYSISRTLTKKFVDEWTKRHAGGTLMERDLNKSE